MLHSIIELLKYKCITIMELKTSLEDKRRTKNTVDKDTIITVMV